MRAPTRRASSSELPREECNALLVYASLPRMCVCVRVAYTRVHFISGGRVCHRPLRAPNSTTRSKHMRAHYFSLRGERRDSFSSPTSSSKMPRRIGYLHRLSLSFLELKGPEIDRRHVSLIICGTNKDVRDYSGKYSTRR